MRLHRLVLTAFLAIGFAVQSRADVVLFSTLGQTDNGTASLDDTNYRLASDFLTDGTPRTITSITARMLNTGLIPHTVTFSIFTDSGATPGSLVGTFDTLSLIPAGGSGTFSATSPGINLLANTTYWVVGQLNENEVAGTVYWDFNIDEGTDGGPFSTVAGTQILRSPNGGGIWSPNTPGNLMYELQGVSSATVPEPSSLALMTTLGTLGAYGRWRRKGKLRFTDGLPLR